MGRGSISIGGPIEMFVTIPLADLFALVAGIAAAMLAGLLALSQKSGTRWLTGFVAVFSFALLTAPLQHLPLPDVLHSLVDWLRFLNLLAVPLLYRYVLFAIGTDTRKVLLHFLPALVFAVLPIFNLDALPLFLAAAQTLQVFVYLPICVTRIRRYRQGLEQQFSSLAGIDLKWLEHLAIWLFLLVAFDVVIFPLASLTGLSHQLSQLSFNLLGTLYMLWLARSALLQHFVLSQSEKIPPSYQKSGLDSDSADNIATAIKAVMADQKLYLKPDLVLSDLAAAAGVTPHIVSEVLNTVVGQNFYDFVNRHRVEAAQILLRESDQAILQIAFAVGFNNKVSFNQAFKKYIQQTPSGFRRSALKKVA